MTARSAIVAGIVAVVIVLAGVTLVVTRGLDSGSAVGPAPASSVPASDPAPVESTAEAGAGTYVEYSEAAVAAAEGRILLFFHASWCPQCRAIEDDIRAQGVPSGVTILHVDYDSNQALRQRYEVTLQTTFVEVDSAGTALQRHVAYDEPSLDAVVAAML